MDEPKKKKRSSVLRDLKKFHPESNEVELLEYFSQKRKKFLEDSGKMLIHQAFRDVGGNKDRFNILYHLGKENYSVTELVNIIGKSQPTISRNVKILEKSRLLVAQKDGKYTFYIPNKPVMEEIKQFLKNWIQESHNGKMD
ncbi:hypothetical protein NEF87_000861 [Candidatus Lokiarchaeum ossiferum]|uniref:HTH arsR-type domain-containing protein n=1 Tax=Candidatus Lokiarchaeum ossiferum TaxID=2951803 RepID=A0ABY6HM41_9ARCH|nr:hypothetical protein NEF87_000861 [Candidatus Lokiarchaeum sp. B-35]